MCGVLMVHFSGFYAWLKEPFSARALEDARQTELIHQAVLYQPAVQRFSRRRAAGRKAPRFLP